MKIKVFIVQQYDKTGKPGEIIDVKLTFAAAHEIAKQHAPAKVLIDEADKSFDISKPVIFGNHIK